MITEKLSCTGAAAIGRSVRNLAIKDWEQMSASLLLSVASAIATGSIKVVDLSVALGPDTPLIKLPPQLAVDTPKVEIHTISNYDDKGPF